MTPTRPSSPFTPWSRPGFDLTLKQKRAKFAADLLRVATTTNIQE